MFEVGEVAPQVDVFPFRIGADSARAPKTKSPAFEKAKAVNAFRIQHILLRLVQKLFKSQCQIHDFVGWCFVDRTIDVITRVDAGHESARWQIDLRASNRVEDAYPRVVKRCVLGIEARAHCSYLRNLLSGTAIEYSNSITHALSV